MYFRQSLIYGAIHVLYVIGDFHVTWFDHCFVIASCPFYYQPTTNTILPHTSLFLLMASSSSVINPSASEAQSRFSYKDASHEEVLEDLSRYMPAPTT